LSKKRGRTVLAENEKPSGHFGRNCGLDDHDARSYWTELCFIKVPTMARNTSGFFLAMFSNSESSEVSDAPGCFSIKSSISFSAASNLLELSGVMSLPSTGSVHPLYVLT
jgi:hypothetical protein